MASKEARVKELETEMEAPDFWDDNDRAQKVIAECKSLRLWTVPYGQLQGRFKDVKALLPEASEMGELALFSELVEELDKIEKELGDLEIRKMLVRRARQQKLLSEH